MKKISILMLIIMISVTTNAFAKRINLPRNNTPIELVFVVDKSGSMRGFESDTIGGYNGVLKEQSKNKNLLVTTALFNQNYEALFDSVSPEKATLNEKNYVPQGSTAMLDAIGKTINDVDARNTPKKERKVIFVIITDGQENSSKEYSYDKIKSMINEKQKKQGWTFMFLGANIDAAGEASKLSIPKKQAGQYKQDKEGNKAMYEAISTNVERAAEGKALDFSELEKDAQP